MRRLLIASAVCLTTFAAATAQPVGFEVEKKDKVGKLEPPTLNVIADNPGQTWIMIGSVVMVLIAVTVNLIPSKRGHQD